MSEPTDGRLISTRRFAALLATGLLLRLLALPLPGTGDVLIWKTWSYNAVVGSESAIYGVGGHPPERRELRYLGNAHFAVDYPPLAVYVLGAAGRVYHRFSPEMRDSPAFTVAVKVPVLLADLALACLVAFSASRR